jgi:hypothetical protein
MGDGRWIVVLMLFVACNSGTKPPAEAAKPPVSTTKDPEIAPGVSSECYAKALDEYEDCTARCKTAPDVFNCCGSCDLTFATTFDNCCKERCEIDDPPPSCADDSAPGCTGGAITHDQARPAWCDEDDAVRRAKH